MNSRCIVLGLFHFLFEVFGRYPTVHIMIDFKERWRRNQFLQLQEHSKVSQKKFHIRNRFHQCINHLFTDGTCTRNGICFMKNPAKYLDSRGKIILKKSRHTLTIDNISFQHGQHHGDHVFLQVVQLSE